MYLVNCSIMILKNKQPKTLARADICLLKAALPHNQFKVTTRDQLKMVFNVFFVLFRGGFLGMSRSIKKHNNNSTTGLHTQCHAHRHTLWIYAQRTAWSINPAEDAPASTQLRLCYFWATAHLCSQARHAKAGKNGYMHDRGKKQATFNEQ